MRGPRRATEGATDHASAFAAGCEDRLGASGLQQLTIRRNENDQVLITYPPITYYWTGLLMLDHSYLVENLT